MRMAFIEFDRIALTTSFNSEAIVSQEIHRDFNRRSSVLHYRVKDIDQRERVSAEFESQSVFRPSHNLFTADR